MPEVTYNNLSCGMNDTDTPPNIGPRQASDMRNIVLSRRGAVKERAGTAAYGSNTTGSTSVLGFHSYVKYSTGVVYPLRVYTTDIYWNNAGTWTAQSQSLTTGKKAEFVDAWDLVYFTNGTDNVRYWDGSSWTADATIPKGTMIAFYENRLLIAGVSGSESSLYFSENGNDTFPSNNYIKVESEITAIIGTDQYFYIFTATDMYRFAKFELIDGGAAGPDKLEKLPSHCGASNQRVVVNAGGTLLTVNQEGIFRTNGFDKVLINIEGKTTWDGLDRDYLVNAAAIFYDNRYFVSVRTSGAASQDKILVFDFLKYHQTTGGELVPAWYYWTGLKASCFAAIPSTTGKVLLYYADDTTGKTYQMESGTADVSTAIDSYFIKPVLTEVSTYYEKHWQQIGFISNTLGSYNVAFSWATAEKPSTFHARNVALTASGRTVKRDVVKPLKYLSGTADATEASKLHDADAGFDSTIASATVHNTTDNTYAGISAYVDSGELTLDANIFTSGEGYEVRWMQENPRSVYFLLKWAGSGTASQPWGIDEFQVRFRVIPRFVRRK